MKKSIFLGTLGLAALAGVATIYAAKAFENHYYEDFDAYGDCKDCGIGLSKTNEAEQIQDNQTESEDMPKDEKQSNESSDGGAEISIETKNLTSEQVAKLMVLVEDFLENV